jgi:hypothetical protein
MGVIKADSHSCDSMGEPFVAIIPISIPPNSAWNFQKAKAKKKCTSNKTKRV